VYAAHRQWEKKPAAATVKTEPFITSADPERQLKIGYVSPDFHFHSVAFFVKPLISGHQRNHFRVHCYSDSRQNDAMQQQLRAKADVWRDTSKMSDEGLFDTIRGDGIDILVDLAGHTSGNRLAVFAQGAAPVQVSYIGYPNTTGLSAMTHRISDAIADPESHDLYYSEQLVRLPGGFLRYSPPDVARKVVREHSEKLEIRKITFGCFNVLAKLSDRTLYAWAEILKALPQAKLMIKNVSMVDDSARKRLQARFRKLGISANRLELIGWQAALEDHFRLYQRIDVALDTFPYNGTTTTCEALYMGVPVVTLKGEAHAARVGASLLTRVGLDLLVADSESDYISICTAIAKDSARLKSLKKQASEGAEHVLCDAVPLLADLEQAYREMWAQWCANQPM